MARYQAREEDGGQTHVNTRAPRGVSLLPASVIVEITSLSLSLSFSLGGVGGGGGGGGGGESWSESPCRGSFCACVRVCFLILWLVRHSIFLLPLLVLSCHVFFLFYFFFVRHSFADDRGSPTLASPETQKNRKKKERITRNRQRLRIVS